MIALRTTPPSGLTRIWGRPGIGISTVHASGVSRALGKSVIGISSIKEEVPLNSMIILTGPKNVTLNSLIY